MRFTIPTTRGTATVTLKGDDVTVQIMVDGVTPLTLHPQHIHAGTTCPTAAQDVNGDGFVDVIEGLPKYGPILVSLDSTINTGASSDLDFPVSNANGSYTYSAEGSRQHIQDEIKTALKLGTRHVVIHGISPDANAMPLPSTVASLPGLRLGPRFRSLAASFTSARSNHHHPSHEAASPRGAASFR